MKSFLLLIIALLLYHSAISQSKNSDWIFEQVEMPNGGSGNNVQSIIQDQRGYIWFGSQSGLHRFDGKSFQTFLNDPVDTTSIADNYIEVLYEDHNGFIWVGTSSKGINRYDPFSNTFQRFPNFLLDTLSGEYHYILDITEDHSHNIWVATLRGLHRIDATRKRFRSYTHSPVDSSSISHDMVVSLYVDRASILWVGTGFHWFSGGKGGLHRYDPKTDNFTRYQHRASDSTSLRSNAIFNMLEDRKGNFWIATGGDGLHLMDREKGTFKHFPFRPDAPSQLSAPNTKEQYREKNVGLRRIFEDQTGNIWLVSFDRGIAVYSPNLDLIAKYEIDPTGSKAGSLTSRSLWGITQSTDGSLWISSGLGGDVFKATPKDNYLTYHNLDQLGITNAKITAMHQDEDENIWLGITRSGLIKYDKNNKGKVYWNKEKYMETPGSGSVRTIISGGQDTILLGISSRIEVFDAKNEIFTSIPFPVPDMVAPPMDQPIMKLYKDQVSNLWISTYNWGLFKYDTRTTNFNHFFPDKENSNGLQDRLITNFFVDSKQRLWVLGSRIPVVSFIPIFDFGFLNEWNQYDEFVLHLPKNNNKIFGRAPISMIELSDQSLWFISWDGGLHQYNPEASQLKYYNPNDGNFPEWDVRWMIKDENDKLWIAGQHKIYHFDPENVTYKTYDIFSGIRGEHVHQNAAYSEDGQLVFTWGNGFYVFDPKRYESVASTWKQPKVSFANLYVNDEKILPEKRGILETLPHLTNQINLKYNQNFFAAELNMYHFKDAAQNQIQYKLEPYDLNWQTLGEDQLAKYNQVAEGNYTLRYKGRSSEGIESEEHQLRIRIYPPWWRSQLAYLTYFLLMIVALLFARRQILQRERLKNTLKLEQIEKEKVQEIDQLRARFFANISHEFRTPLTLIKAPLEDLLMSKKNKIERKTSLQMHQNTERLLHLVNQLLDLSRLESGILNLQEEATNIYTFLRQIAGNFDSIAQQKQIDFEIQTPENQLVLELDRDKIEKIILNLLSNAFKFTPQNGWIKIEANYTEQLQIKVGNSGDPIPKNEQQKIFERFYQAGDTRHQGDGVGLALVRELVVLQKGSIRVESNEIQGTWFWVELPLARALNPLAPEEENELLQKQDISSSWIEQKEQITPLKSSPTLINAKEKKDKPLLLIVEDHPEVRDYITYKLVDQYQIIDAENGKAGFEKASQEIPDLIISDVMMPVMDGVQFCQKIKNDHRTDHIPVILLTAKADIESRLEGLQTGADDYLAKPFNSRELQARCSNLIQQRQKLKEHFQKGIPIAPSAIEVDSASTRFLKKAIAIVEQHMDDSNFSIDFFAQNMQLSRVQLHRKLKAIAGMSATDFLRNLRLERAASLLQQKSDNISQIAYQVGFENLSYFTKCFKEKYGVTPSKYKK